MERKILLFVAVVYSCAVTALFFLPSYLLVPNEKVSKINIPHIDKWVHGIIFFVLIYLWQWYFYKHKKHNLSAVTITVLLVILMFYGIIIEVFQELSPVSRSGDVFDFLADLLGALLGILVFKMFKEKFHS